MGLGPGFFWLLNISPPLCASKPLPFNVKNMVTHIHAKAFVGTREGGGVNDILKNGFRFLYTVYLNVKLIVLPQILHL